MKKLTQFMIIVSAFLFFGCGISAMAENEVKLQFKRTGNNAGSVTISVVDGTGAAIEGASATLTSTHNFKGSGGNVTESILCPNANGNSKPNINLTFTLSGLPADYTFNQVGLDIHALNGGGNYQSNSDGNNRQFNVVAQTGKETGALSDFGTLTDIDIAAGVGDDNGVHKVWTIKNKEAVKVNGNLVVNVNITAGSANSGCFFGLSELSFSTVEIVDPKPDPQPEPGNKTVYTIAWKNGTGSYMTEKSDGTLAVFEYDIANRQFWEFIATDKPNCYYIKNTATGHYIGSCNMTPSDESLIRVSETPVEYYVGRTTSTSGDIAGCYYFTSTDCADYDNESAGPQALNKDGATGNIITWQAGTNRKGSYWSLTESEDLYEIRPFETSDTIGQPSTSYVMTSLSGKALEMAEDGTLSWQDKKDNEAQLWYFVGTSNRTEGYYLVNQKNHKTYNLPGETATRWYVLENQNGMGYYFRPYATKADPKTTLKVGEDSLFVFRTIHSQFARHHQIYELPCGNLVNAYIVRLNISGEIEKPMQYPLPVRYGRNVITKDAPKPESWFTLYAQDQAIVVAGKKFELSFVLNEVPATGQEGYVYFDWNRDGIFETMVPVSLAKENQMEINVPQDAVPGESRFRVRLTDNGLAEADDEATGHIFDGILHVVSTATTDPVLTVQSNSEERGEVSPATANGMNQECEVTATPKGNAYFICWREGNNIVSVEKSYHFTLNRNRNLVGYFSPNTRKPVTGIDETLSEKAQLVEITAENKQIKVVSAAPVKKVLVFTSDGALVASSDQSTVNLSSTPAGTYIVKVFTAEADGSAKIVLK